MFWNFGKGLGVEAGVAGGFFDFLAVFVGAGEEVDFFTVQPLEAGDHVGRDGGVGVPDMRCPVHIEDRRSEIIAHNLCGAALIGGLGFLTPAGSRGRALGLSWVITRPGRVPNLL
jgi:hypothetical protein